MKPEAPPTDFMGTDHKLEGLNAGVRVCVSVCVCVCVLNIFLRKHSLIMRLDRMFYKEHHCLCDVLAAFCRQNPFEVGFMVCGVRFLSYHSDLYGDIQVCVCVPACLPACLPVYVCIHNC